MKVLRPAPRKIPLTFSTSWTLSTMLSLPTTARGWLQPGPLAACMRLAGAYLLDVRNPREMP
ncbi:MAG TPA: hypothetical protein VGO18_13015 [Steroidobacteraceae bacterium]|nr:hypothetical protein [Steroidobacteraceae bacterium]